MMTNTLANNQEETREHSKRLRIDVKGSELAYVDVGEGEPILLLHGYPATAACWRHQIRDLSRSFRVIAPDWFGFGYSERRFDTNPTYDFEVNRIAYLLDVLGIRSASIIGHDYGGYLALGLAARQPERVRRLGVLNCRGHRTFPQPTYALFAALCMTARLPILRRGLVVLPFYRALLMLLARFANEGGPMEGMLESYLSWMKSAQGRRWIVHFYRYYEIAENKTLFGQLCEIRCPTRIIWGDRDPYCPMSIAEELGDVIPFSTVCRLKGAGHFIPESRPDPVTREIRALMSKG